MTSTNVAASASQMNNRIPKGGICRPAFRRGEGAAMRIPDECGLRIGFSRVRRGSPIDLQARICIFELYLSKLGSSLPSIFMGA